MEMFRAIREDSHAPTDGADPSEYLREVMTIEFEVPTPGLIPIAVQINKHVYPSVH